MMSVHKFLFSLLPLFSLFALCACDDEDDNKDSSSEPSHTFLLYLVGDNNLSTDLETNDAQAQKAILDSVSAGTLNLVVMKDNNATNDNLPTLYWIRRGNDYQLDTVILKQWDAEQDAASVEFMAEVLQTTFTRFNTTIKGMAFGSHALSWVPYNNYKKTSTARSLDVDNETAYFGADSHTGSTTTSLSTIDLWDLPTAFAGIDRLDYLILDCCYSGTMETLYELRDVTRYLVGSPAEVEGEGMPYLNVVTRLSRCQSKADLPEALQYAMSKYYSDNTPYNGKSRFGALTSLYDLDYAAPFATAYRQLLQAADSTLTTIRYSEPTTEVNIWRNQFQDYGRPSTTTRMLFYDIEQYVNYLGSYDATACTTALSALQNLIVYHLYSTQYHEIDINSCCGLAVSIPELFHLADYATVLNCFYSRSAYTLTTAYALTAWGDYMNQ